MRDFFKVLKFATREKVLFSYTILLTVCLTITNLLVPLVFKRFFDLIEFSLKNQSLQSLTQPLITLSVGYWGILGFQSIISSLNLYVSSRWWFIVLNDLTIDIYSRLQRLSIDFFETNSTGKIRERTSVGAQALLNIVDRVFRVVAVQTLFTLITVVLLFRINLVYGLLAITGVPILLYISMRNKKYWTSFQKRIRKNWEEFSEFWNDSVSNARIIRSFTKESAQEKKIEKILGIIKNDGLTVNKILNFNRIKRSFVLDTFRVASISYGVYLVTTGNLTLGTFTLAYTYLDRALSPLQDLATQLEEIQKKLIETKLLFEFLEIEPTVKDAPNAVNPKKVNGSVEFQNVKYSYGDRKVLNGVSLKVEQGSTVAFVGKSGAGKSTLIKLLLRLYDVDSGKVTIDGIDIRSITQKALRENISVVFQEPYLFNDTVRFNISYGAHKRPGLKKIVASAKLANADDFIEKLKKSYNTVIGERGVKLSGGEQQRISIARAMIKDAPIIVLDEATSNLDSESEILIQDALSNLTRNKTTFIIAHRLSTVMKADMIVVMDKGKIVETGTHQDLVEQKGIYSKLFEIQSGGYLDTIDAELAGVK